jgi:membrane-bound lytic murein transglycosylase B
MPQLRAVLLTLAATGGLLVLALAAPRAQQAEPLVDSAQPFSAWRDGAIAEARTRGFDEKVIATTLAGIEPLERVITRDRNQPEVSITLDRYYRSHVNARIVRRGRELGRQHRTVLTRIERAYGVPGRVILAVWGMETRYGANTGRTPIFQALATLAWEPRRSDFFRGELFNALTMVANGSIDAKSMTGSWAGAMGQTQFMPSSYLAYAVDFDRDGRRDIWKSTPDALASIGNYLKGYGWKAGTTWGREIKLSAAVAARVAEAVPQRTEGCYAIRNLTEQRPVNEWQRLGVRRVDGGPLPRATIPASIARSGDRTFLVYQNYEAILGYNCSHSYALTVALLSDRLR